MNRYLNFVGLLALSTLIAVWVAGASAQGTLNLQQLRTLVADDSYIQDEFGRAVGVYGQRAIIGAPGYVDPFSITGPSPDIPGKAYVYDIATGELLFTLTGDATDYADGFGYDVDIHGTVALVGAYFENVVAQGSGAAYLFDTTTGEQLHKLVPDDTYEIQQIGLRVAVSDQYAMVSTPLDSENGNNSGAAYVFDVLTGQQLHKITPPNASASQFFANAIAIDGNIGIIGAWGDENDDGRGAAYLYNLATGQLLHKLVPDDIAAGDRFGDAVAIDDGRAIVMAPGAGTGGIAYVFDVATGAQLRELTADANDSFYDEVPYIDFDTPHVLIGGSQPGDGCCNEPTVFMFNAQTGQRLPNIEPDDGAPDASPTVPRLYGNLAVVGSRRVNFGTSEDAPGGVTYVFDLLGLATPAEADVNDDLRVTALDAVQVKNRIPNDATGLEAFDVNGDNVINADDFDAVMSLLGQSVPVEP